MLNFTCAARPSSRESSTSVRFTPFAQSGYDSKSAMTARMSSGGASITIDWVDSSAMRSRLPGSSPPQRVRPAEALEVSDVDAFGAADPDAAGHRLVDVAEDRPAGLFAVDRVEHRDRPRLG